MKKSYKQNQGFSLVEVAVALSIASFCMVTLMGLIPVGLHNYLQADSQNVMVNLATGVAQDLQLTTEGTASAKSPLFSFVVPPSGGSKDVTPQTVYVDASGQPTSGPTDPNSIYRLSVAFIPPANNLKVATVARVLVTFPARADSNPAIWPTRYSSMFETTVVLNRN